MTSMASANTRLHHDLLIAESCRSSGGVLSLTLYVLVAVSHGGEAVRRRLSLTAASTSDTHDTAWHVTT
jgi:hypothetical protein